METDWCCAQSAPSEHTATVNRNWFVSVEFVILGISPISSLLVGELFPLEYRGIGSSIATSFSYFCAFISVKTFIDFQVCAAIDQLSACAVDGGISQLKCLILSFRLGNLGFAWCILVVRVHLVLWPIFCCDVCAGNEGQRSWRNGPKIRTNHDNKSMRFGNSRRIFSVVVVVVFIVVFCSNFFMIDDYYNYWQRIKSKQFMIFFCLTFRCLVRTRVGQYLRSFFAVLLKCKYAQVCIQFLLLREHPRIKCLRLINKWSCICKLYSSDEILYIYHLSIVKYKNVSALWPSLDFGFHFGKLSNSLLWIFSIDKNQ